MYLVFNKRVRVLEMNEQKLRDVIASLIIEQATCERSGERWGEDMLKELDKALPVLGYDNRT
jgi:hypothetical protein